MQHLSPPAYGNAHSLFLQEDPPPLLYSPSPLTVLSQALMLGLPRLRSLAVFSWEGLSCFRPPSWCLWLCYHVQACSADHMIGQWIRETSYGGKEYNFIGKADWLRRWQTQNNLLVGIWTRVLLLSQREKQWGTEVKRQNREGEAVRK